MLFTFSRSLVLRISCRKSQIQRRSRTYPCRIANHRRARFVDELSRACVSDVSQLSRRRPPRGGLRRPDFHPRAQRKCACTSCVRVRGMSPGPALPLYPSIDSARDRWGTAPSCSDTPAPTGTCPWNRLRTICGRRLSRAVPPLLCGSCGRASCMNGGSPAGAGVWRARASIAAIPFAAGGGTGTGRGRACFVHRVRRKRRRPCGMFSYQEDGAPWYIFSATLQ